MAGNASIRVNERIRKGAENMLKRNPTSHDLYDNESSYKNQSQ